jgi:hypothetical protein
VRSILLNVFLFSFIVSYGQSLSLDKKELLRVLNLTISQKLSTKKTSCENGLCGEWFINNKDSAFYKFDTLRIYNSSNIMYDTNHYCNFKVWEFSKLNKFSQHSIEICHEPPISRIEGTCSVRVIQIKGQKKFTKISTAPEEYKIIERDGSTFLLLYTGNKIFYTFKVIEINNHNSILYSDQSFMIMLVRQRVK